MEPVKRFTLTAVIGLMLMLVACAPKGAPTSSTPSPSAPPPAPPAASNKSTPVAQDAVWAKVLEDGKKEGVVNVYSFGFIGDIGISFTKAFKRDTGINLELTTGTGAQLLPRIESESRSGQSTADVLEGSTVNAVLAKQRGLTQPYSPIPQLQAGQPWVIDPHFDKEGHIITYSYSINGPWINTNMVKPTDVPKSWKSLLDPKWKGKIIMMQPDTSQTPNYIYVTLTRYMGFDDNYFRDLGKLDPIIVATQRDNDAGVARGEAPLALTSNLSTMASLAAQGAPVKPIDMSEGLPGLGNVAVIALNKAPHPNAARVFINWLMSKEGQDAHGRARSVWSIRKDVPDYTPENIRIQYGKVVTLTSDDLVAAAQVQTDQVLSKLWKK